MKNGPSSSRVTTPCPTATEQARPMAVELRGAHGRRAGRPGIELGEAARFRSEAPAVPPAARNRRVCWSFLPEGPGAGRANKALGLTQPRGRNEQPRLTPGGLTTEQAREWDHGRPTDPLLPPARPPGPGSGARTALVFHWGPTGDHVFRRQAERSFTAELGFPQKVKETPGGRDKPATPRKLTVNTRLQRGLCEPRGASRFRREGIFAVVTGGFAVAKKKSRGPGLPWSFRPAGGSFREPFAVAVLVGHQETVSMALD